MEGPDRVRGVVAGPEEGLRRHTQVGPKEGPRRVLEEAQEEPRKHPAGSKRPKRGPGGGAQEGARGPRNLRGWPRKGPRRVLEKPIEGLGGAQQGPGGA